ncbi:hypothetical protein BCR35DRAFT_297972 [Leucosporidium creatinivorum]|uniref:Uncharacterized protein n=1 Tax=Leucosporidium creatinivorum TaxID=106004 RepID=A0A1Y2G3M0_9BASI|nr:hypothetical protein BCR35DRAFT_297972 [Leucosporidium creatinivorum]
MTSRWSLPEDDQPAATAPAAPSASLTDPILYVGGISEAVSDAQIVEALWECLKVRPRIERAGDPSAPAKGHIEFESLDRAQKAYATVNGQAFPEFSSALSLHLSPALTEDPAPNAVPRLFKSLPLNTTAGSLFDLCRPFGPVHRVALQLAEGPRRSSGASTVFKGQALVTFYDEEHAKVATEELHCSELHGNTIIVQNFIPARARKSDIGAATATASPQQSPSRWAAPAAFTPGELALGHGHPPLNAVAAPFTPPQQRSFSTTSQVSIHAGGSPTSPRVSQHGNGSPLPSAQSAIPIDPSNLFVKSLDPTITSQDLFFLFKNFGRIISAKVMTDAEGRSKEFGFVSYEQPEQAAAALQAMNGQPAGPSERIITVRFHEPKKFREGRMRQASSADGMSELDHGMQSLSTTATPDLSPNPNTYSPSPDTPRRASSTFESSPALAASSRATSPSSSPVALPQSEHDRLVSAVQKLEPTQFGEIVQLLEGLPKKDRAMCLFNPEYLKQKVADALIILSSDDETTAASTTSPAPAVSADPAPLPSSTSTPAHPAEPLPASLPELAALPAATIISLESQLGPLGVGKVEEEKRSEMDSFMDGLEGKPPHEVKQKLGERLFKAIKATGIKGAPRITIALLDTEELRPLAHLINLPQVLKEKVLIAAATPAK